VSHSFSKEFQQNDLEVIISLMKTVFMKTAEAAKDKNGALLRGLLLVNSPAIDGVLSCMVKEVADIFYYGLQFPDWVVPHANICIYEHKIKLMVCDGSKIVSRIHHGLPVLGLYTCNKQEQLCCIH
jgi:hypothetical protein